MAAFADMRTTESAAATADYCWRERRERELRCGERGERSVTPVFAIKTAGPGEKADSAKRKVAKVE